MQSQSRDRKPAESPPESVESRPQSPAAPTAGRRSRGPLWTMMGTIWTIAGILVAAAVAVYLLRVTGLVDPASLRQQFSSLLVFEDDHLASNIVVFFIVGAVIWIAGSRLSVLADLISERTGLGHAFVGLLLLAVATSLPEVATSATAAAIGNAELVTGGLLGGTLMQITILAAMDLLLVRRGVLTFFAPHAQLMINGVTLVALLALVVAGVAAGSAVSFWGVSIWTPLIFVCYLLIIWTNYSVGDPQWMPVNPPDSRSQERPGEDRKELTGEKVQRQESQRYRGTPNRRLYRDFALGAAVILAAGFLVTRVSDAIAVQTGIGSTLVGAVLLALATSLPEISTCAKAVRLGAYSMAISGIFGACTFNLSLLFLADVIYRQDPILKAASGAALLLTGLTIFATCAHLWGMLERKNKTFLGMGVPSVVVLLTYICGMVLLYRVI